MIEPAARETQTIPRLERTDATAEAEGFGMRSDAETPHRGRAETVGLITPSHRGDLERCALLFESLDRHVHRRGQHYVIVHDEDVGLFERFRRSDRHILAASDFLPGWLRPIPLLRWRGRRYWWSFHGQPISGWHTQQIVKIEAARSLPEQRYCIIDSDNVFFRDFDLDALACPNPAPLHVYERGVTEHRPRHMKWIGTASRLLGTPKPSLPADDYIDQIIVWDQTTVRAMIARIEAVTGRNWIAALCRDRDFSEYIIYGSFVANTPSARALHAPKTESFCRTYWDSDVLSEAEILAMLDSASVAQSVLCIQSFGPTSLTTIRTSLDRFYSRNTTKKDLDATVAA